MSRYFLRRRQQSGRTGQELAADVGHGLVDDLERILRDHETANRRGDRLAFQQDTADATAKGPSGAKSAGIATKLIAP